MPNINITVAEKIATNTTPGEVIVCGNGGYTVAFTFDSEWDAETERTARFVYYKDGQSRYQDVDFTGNTVAVPPLYGVDYVLVGVYTDNLRTTTPARVNCDRSILCGDPLEVLTPEQTAKLQAQIGDLSKLDTEAKANLVAAINEAAKLGAQNGHLVTVSVWKDYNTEQYVADKSYAELKAAKGEGKQIFAFYGNAVFIAGAYEPGSIRFYEVKTERETFYGQFTLSSAGWYYENVEEKEVNRAPLYLDAEATAYLVDSSYGDAALEAIKTERQILVRVPNADGGNYTAIYAPVLMYQVPNYQNKYLYLFFLRDEKQDLSELLGLPAGTVQIPTYGELKMLLSQEYNSNPLETAE